MKNTLSKSERLTSNVSISEIYNKGQHLNEYPFKIVWRYESKQENCGLKVVFSVPKKKFKRAVDRNRIKRLLREAYRHHKHIPVQEIIKHEKSVAFFLIYLGKKIPNYKLVESKIILLLNRLTKEVTSK